MHADLTNLGADWLRSEVQLLPDKIHHITPVDFNEKMRYLPASVTSAPGYIKYSRFPFLKEILNNFDVNNNIREVNLLKGVQTGCTTLLESIFLYFMEHVKSCPSMLVTADEGIAKRRMENNFIPMLVQSGLIDRLQSSDITNKRKTGNTAKLLQWPGGFLLPMGANSPGKMREASIMLMLKDELDGWMETVGDDGDPDELTDDRCSGYWEKRKIFRGSTPLLHENSKMTLNYLRGDQREYRVVCRACNFPQALRWNGINAETSMGYGFVWELEEGTLINESVRYLCRNCGHAHTEHDKTKLFATEEGAKWVPTNLSAPEEIRSYHLPAFYSPAGFQPWYKCVSMYLKAWDPENKIAKNVGKLQVFYNNVLGQAFKTATGKVKFEMVSAHRRLAYRLGQVPATFAKQHTGSRILMLTCTVDVQKDWLAVSVFGWTRGSRSFLIDYHVIEDTTDIGDCTDIESPVWDELGEIVENREYVADDNTKYRIHTTLIDSRYGQAAATEFCARYETNVYPIMGTDRAAKNARIDAFAKFTTKQGSTGYKIVVDHYKDRMAPALKREWMEGGEEQPSHHFNAPADTPDNVLKQLTAEYKRKKVDARGFTSYEWYRPSGSRNELWDLLIYGQAAVEIVAWMVCIEQHELPDVNWTDFWDYMEETLDFHQERG